MINLRVGRHRSLIVTIDSNGFEALQRLGDFVPQTLCKDFIEKVCSLLLASLLMKSRDDAVDGFERLIADTSVLDRKKADRMWGEYLQLLNYFKDMHGHDEDLVVELKNIQTGELRVYPEERFQVEFSRRGSYLLVS